MRVARTQWDFLHRVTVRTWFRSFMYGVLVTRKCMSWETSYEICSIQEVWVCCELCRRLLLSGGRTVLSPSLDSASAKMPSTTFYRSCKYSSSLPPPRLRRRRRRDRRRIPCFPSRKPFRVFPIRGDGALEWKSFDGQPVDVDLPPRRASVRSYPMSRRNRFERTGFRRVVVCAPLGSAHRVRVASSLIAAWLFSRKHRADPGFLSPLPPQTPRPSRSLVVRSRRSVSTMS